LITVTDLGKAREKVSVNLASGYKGKRANLFVNGRFVGFATLNSKGDGTWNLRIELRSGDQLRISIDGKSVVRRTL
jgi:D-aminopeptidase